MGSASDERAGTSSCDAAIGTAAESPARRRESRRPRRSGSSSSRVRPPDRDRATSPEGVWPASSCRHRVDRRTAGGGRRRQRPRAPDGRAAGHARRPCRAARARPTPRRTSSSCSGHDAAPVSASTSRSRRATGRITPRPTTRASVTASAGTTQSPSAWTPTIGATPGTRRIDPSRPSSPQKASSRTASDGITSKATSSPTAIARSSPEPVLRYDGGARLTVIFLSGQVYPHVTIAARTRSRASRHDSSGSPSIVKPGMPLATWTSTLTGCPRAPRIVADRTVAIISTSRDRPSAGAGGDVQEGVATAPRQLPGTIPMGCRIATVAGRGGLLMPHSSACSAAPPAAPRPCASSFWRRSSAAATTGVERCRALLW